MGAFDCDVAALGVAGRRPDQRDEFKPNPDYVEPEIGARVMACELIDRLPGTVVYCSEETVVVRFDKPHKGRWRKEAERSYCRPNTRFYPS